MLFFLTALTLAEPDTEPRSPRLEDLIKVSDSLDEGWLFWHVDVKRSSVYTTRFVWANMYSKELLGIKDRGSVIGQSFASIVHDSDSEGGRRIVTTYKDALTTHSPIWIERMSYDGVEYAVTILPLDDSVVAVRTVPTGRTKVQGLRVPDDQWLKVQIQTLSSLQQKSHDRIEHAEEAAEEVDADIDVDLDDTDVVQIDNPFNQAPMP